MRTTPICRGDHNLKQAGRRRQMPFAGISGSFGSHWGTGLRPALVGGHPNRPLEGGVAPSHGVFRRPWGAIPKDFGFWWGAVPRCVRTVGVTPSHGVSDACGAPSHGVFPCLWGTVPKDSRALVGRCPTVPSYAVVLLSQTQKRRSSMHAHQRCPEAKVLSGPIRRPREALVGARPRGAGLRGWESQGQLPLCPHLPYRVPSEALS